MLQHDATARIPGSKVHIVGIIWRAWDDGNVEKRRTRVQSITESYFSEGNVKAVPSAGWPAGLAGRPAGPLARPWRAEMLW